MVETDRHILIVDDSLLSRERLSVFFKKSGWIVHTASNGLESVRITPQINPDIILMDIIMPIMDGIKACRLIKNSTTSTRIFPIIMITSLSDKKSVSAAIRAGCDGFVMKPFKLDPLLIKVNAILESLDKKMGVSPGVVSQPEEEKSEPEIIIYARDVSKELFFRLQKKKTIDYPEIQEVVNGMVEIVMKEGNLPLAYKMMSYDDYIYVHSVNVASLCMSFAHNLNWDKQDLVLLGEGGFLHDIGKISIDREIVMKPGKLTDAEFAEMMKHPLYSQEILTRQGISKSLQLIPLEHHERINGKGYPYKLNGNQISRFGKLACIVDVYDALTTDRCYRRGIDSETAILEMSKMEGFFDFTLFNEFVTLSKNEFIGK